MPVIKPRTRGKHMLRHVTRFDRENTEMLYAYAAFIGEPAEYVLNQLVETVLAKDKDFVAWRAVHPDSYVPPPQSRAPRGRTRRAPASDRRDGVVPTPTPVALAIKG
jgi:hypothetical protein